MEQAMYGGMLFFATADIAAEHPNVYPRQAVALAA